MHVIKEQKLIETWHSLNPHSARSGGGGGGHADTRVLSLSKIYILISVELVSTQDAAAPSWSGEVGGVCVWGGGGGGCWHQGFVFEQDILISVELVSTQEAAVPS